MFVVSPEKFLKWRLAPLSTTQSISNGTNYSLFQRVILHVTSFNLRIFHYNVFHNNVSLMSTNRVKPSDHVRPREVVVTDRHAAEPSLSTPLCDEKLMKCRNINAGPVSSVGKVYD